MSEELCPCCQQPATPGLFEHRPVVATPLAIERLSDIAGEPVGVEDEPFLTAYGRWFVPCEVFLPLGSKSPVQIRVWLEISESDVRNIRAVIRGERRSFSSAAPSGCDFPGFPGAAGSLCRYRIRSGQEIPEMTSCSDSRISEIPDVLDHQGYAALYRRIWGNEDPLPEVNYLARHQVRSDWQEWLERRTYSRLVAPPPRLAGMEPAEVLVAPPVDTNEPALLVTVGCSDVPGDNNRYYEMSCQIRNPSEDFIRCFGEFSYISRMNPSRIGPGAVVPERTSIPDTDEEMVAWLLAWPWWEPSSPETRVLGDSISYLTAIPLYSVEAAYAAFRGTEELLRAFIDQDPDLASLDRQPVVSEAFDG
jgi:hypothetical protein